MTEEKLRRSSGKGRRENYGCRGKGRSVGVRRGPGLFYFRWSTLYSGGCPVSGEGSVEEDEDLEVGGSDGGDPGTPRLYGEGDTVTVTGVAEVTVGDGRSCRGTEEGLHCQEVRTEKESGSRSRQVK